MDCYPAKFIIKKYYCHGQCFGKTPQTFCIEDPEILEDTPHALARDTNYVMNKHNGYVELSEDEHDTTVPMDLMH